MSSAARKKSNSGHEYTSEVTGALVQFLYSAGLEKKEIESRIRDAIRQLPTTRLARKVSGIDAGTASIIGSAFHRWFRSKAYIDRNGKPIPLPLLGRGKSVQSLISLEGGSARPEMVANELVRLRLVKKQSTGLYAPTALHSLIRRNHPYMFEYVAHSIVRFLHTVAENAKGVDGSIPSIERYAQVSSIPASKVREFKDFSSQQGEALIDTINDWLEANRTTSKAGRSTKSVQAGLHVFAYVASREQSPRR